MRGAVLGREGEITVKIPTSTKKGRVGEFDPAGEPTEKTYKFRFSMKALLRAERYFNALPLPKDADGAAMLRRAGLKSGAVKAILDYLLDGTLDNFLLLTAWMLVDHQPNITDTEVYAIVDADLDAVQSAVYEVVGRSVPEPKEEADDPKAPPTTKPESPAEESQPSLIS